MKKYARHVQRAIEEDTSFAMPSYTWCLQQVQLRIAAALEDTVGEGDGTRSERVKSMLVDRIKPNARRAG